MAEKKNETAAAAATTEKKASNRRQPGFQEKLLAQLPVLSFHSLSITNTLDVKNDLGSIVELDAEAFVDPLEALVALNTNKVRR